MNDENSLNDEGLAIKEIYSIDEQIKMMLKLKDKLSIV